jgi:DNA-binding Xre family transcriptional regulator
MNKRHVAIYRILRPLAALFIHVRFRFRSEKPKNLPKQYMLLSNHATDYDPVLIASAFPEDMYFMGSEHIARWGFLSKLIRWLVDPILLSKGAPTAGVVLELLRRMRAGHNVCFFPEGLRTWDGVTNPIPPATGKLVKKAGCALITYKLTGAYFASPMWGGAQVRRGPVRGNIVHIYSAEDVAAMTPAQLQQEAGYSANISTRLRRDIYISLESVEKICRVLNCKVDDIVEFIPDDQAKKKK